MRDVSKRGARNTACPDVDTNHAHTEIWIGRFHSGRSCNRFLVAAKLFRMWWPETGSNRRRQPFQGCALPAELSGQLVRVPDVGCLHYSLALKIIACSQTDCSCSSWSAVDFSTSACRLFPCASMVTIAGKLFTRRCHMASGIPNSIRFTSSTSSTVRA
jgi:hypothetical protein